MQIEFNSSHLLLVLILLCLVCMCRQMTDIGSSIANIIEKCTCSCIICPCFDDFNKVEFARKTVILYICLLPITFNAIFFGLSFFSKSDWASSVALMDWYANETSVVYPHSNTAFEPLPLSLAPRSTAIMVDYMFCVMPFACSAMLTCLVWVHYTTHAERGCQYLLAPDTQWDHDLPPALLGYELAYCVEMFCMNFSMLTVSSSGRSAVEVVMATIALSLIMCTFLSFSRQRHEDSLQQSAMACMFFLLAVVLCVLWSVMLQRSCVVACCAAVVHATCVALIVGFHFGANGEASASAVILLRVSVTMIASFLHVGVLITGRNRLC
jgi:hypothetical protein